MKQRGNQKIRNIFRRKLFRGMCPKAKNWNRTIIVLWKWERVPQTFNCYETW